MEMVEVIGVEGKELSHPIQLERQYTEIKKGDWVVYFNKLYKYNDSFFLSRDIVDIEKLKKVKYE